MSTRAAVQARAMAGSRPSRRYVKMKSGSAPMASLNGLYTTTEAPKMVRSRGAVSPATRATPRMPEVTSPDFAVGSTIPATVRHWVAPSAAPASRRSLGTSFSTSSAVRATVGSMRMASAMPPARPVYLPPGPSTQAL